ncbi:hypothetical protein [Streptomyces sp. NPDC017556]|uniref:hypothetical protein n=1 Tax=Streptomyces sp. NPDC017556 TaxID=3365002 RepID=UPI0037A966BA
MSSRAGEEFDAERAAAEVTELLAAPVPATGPTVVEGDPDTGEWTVTVGEGFRIVPLWEGRSLTGVYAPEWNEAVEAAEGHLESLARESGARWGPHRPVRLHVALLRWEAGASVEPLFEALFTADLYGDLVVWGPFAPDGRWIALTVGHSDGDAPMVLAALVSDRPIIEPDDGDSPL